MSTQTPLVFVHGNPETSAVRGPLLATRVDAMRALGIAGTVAERLAAGMDADMGRAILSLYRTARQPVMNDAGSHAAGADVVELDGLGHWWMLQNPTRSAAVLQKYFAQQERH